MISDSLGAEAKIEAAPREGRLLTLIPLEREGTSTGADQNLDLVAPVWLALLPDAQPSLSWSNPTPQFSVDPPQSFPLPAAQGERAAAPASVRTVCHVVTELGKKMRIFISPSEIFTTLEKIHSSVVM